MENQPPDNFEDASLKSAVRRAWGNERAPESLRKSIALMATPTPTTPPARGWPKFLGSSPIKSVAAAVLLSIGLAYLGYQAYRMTRPAQVRVMVERIPDSMAHKLADDHDRLLADANKWSPDLPRDNPDQLAATLKKKLNYVPMTASPGDGFALVGTASLGKGNGAELLYQKGNQTVSVFSLPASDVPMCDNNAILGGNAPNHPMAGFVHDRGFYMLVGSSADNSMSLSDVQALRDKLRPSIPGACPSH